MKNEAEKRENKKETAFTRFTKRHEKHFHHFAGASLYPLLGLLQYDDLAAVVEYATAIGIVSSLLSSLDAGVADMDTVPPPSLYRIEALDPLSCFVWSDEYQGIYFLAWMEALESKTRFLTFFSLDQMIKPEWRFLQALWPVDIRLRSQIQAQVYQLELIHRIHSGMKQGCPVHFYSTQTNKMQVLDGDIILQVPSLSSLIRNATQKISLRPSCESSKAKKKYVNPKDQNIDYKSQSNCNVKKRGVAERPAASGAKKTKKSKNLSTDPSKGKQRPNPNRTPRFTTVNNQLVLDE